MRAFPILILLYSCSALAHPLGPAIENVRLVLQELSAADKYSELVINGVPQKQFPFAALKTDLSAAWADAMLVSTNLSDQKLADAGLRFSPLKFELSESVSQSINKKDPKAWEDLIAIIQERLTLGKELDQIYQSKPINIDYQELERAMQPVAHGTDLKAALKQSEETAKCIHALVTVSQKVGLIWELKEDHIDWDKQALFQSYGAYDLSSVSAETKIHARSNLRYLHSLSMRHQQACLTNAEKAFLNTQLNLANQL